MFLSKLAEVLDFEEIPFTKDNNGVDMDELFKIIKRWKKDAEE